VDAQWTVGDIAHFQHLAVVDPRLNESGRHVDHQAQAGKAAPALEKAAQIPRQRDALERDAVDRPARLEHVGLIEPLNPGVIAKIRCVQNVDGVGTEIHHANLVAQGEIDRRRSHLVAEEGRDSESPGVEFGEDRIARQHGHGRTHGTVCDMRHPYFALPTPLVIGHRGCAGEAPENTLVAFERGLAAGAAILETDVHLTRDGVPVLMHDAEVDRVTDGAGPVCDFALEELRCLDAGHRFSPDGGKTHPFRGQGLRIPTFEEALKAFPGERFNLELKADRPEIVEATVDAVVRNGRESLTLLTAGDDDLMARMRSHIASRNVPVAQGASVADILDVVRTAQDGSAPTTPSMALQIPAEFGGRPLVTRELVDHAHAHAIQVHVWTINTAEEMAAMPVLGVDGIVTDFPGHLTELIERRRAAGGG